MNKELDETLKLFLLKDSELRMKAEIEGMKFLKSSKYNDYDREFKQNFLKSFVSTFVSQINDNRENLAYTLTEHGYPKDITAKAGRISLTKVKELDVSQNKADILRKYLNNIKE